MERKEQDEEEEENIFASLTAPHCEHQLWPILFNLW